MLMPGSVRYCGDPSLWVPFHSEPRHKSVAIVSVADKRPEEQQVRPPPFLPVLACSRRAMMLELGLEVGWGEGLILRVIK